MPGDQRRDDELAETATATPADPVPAITATAVERPQPPTRDSGLSTTLGRYKIGRELGRGGMGVVHSAFDPDLERKVALKVLPAEVENTDARQRLLREARAMARLSHPNVVTVHEVGTVHGRDFIAMELIDGTTLEDWLESSQRGEREIIDAFVAAGRGLAAAHAAGLVHRDFKPRNVLRHKDGRIVVTDFGLVVGVEGGDPDAFKVTMPSGPVSAKTTPSSLSGLTKTGSVLGTPAYMAPEQWTGGQVGPAADQFAFCVALWEALAKERPYKGSTIEDLKDVVLRGKRADEGKLPRKLRKVLRRGLDPDPGKRYPDMGALLGAIERSERRPVVMLAIGGAAVVAAAVIYVVAVRSPGTAKTYIVQEACSPPVMPPDKVWTASDRDALKAAHQELAADLLDTHMKVWHDVRADACAAASGAREPMLACLDGVLTRIDVVKAALLAGKAAPTREVNDLLVEPTTCQNGPPPRLTRFASAEERAVVRMYLEHQAPNPTLTEADIPAVLAAGGGDPCAMATAHQLVASIISGTERADELSKAERDAQSCGDDRLLTDIAMNESLLASAYAEREFRTAMGRSEVLAARVMEPFVLGQLEEQRSYLAVHVDDVDAVIQHDEKAAQLYEKASATRAAIKARAQVLSWKARRAAKEDLARHAQDLEDLRAVAVKKLGPADSLVEGLDGMRAQWMWQSGDLAGAEELRRRIMHPEPPKSPQVLHGQVVDENGPVAGARVTVGTALWGDGLNAAGTLTPDQRTVVSGPDGSFTFDDAEAKAYIIAQHGDLRSAPMLASDKMTVKLAPTSRVSGIVELHDRAPSQVTLYIVPKAQSVETPYFLMAPIRADGTFSSDGVPRGAILFRTSVNLSTSQMVDAKEVVVNKPVVDGVHLEVKASGRPLDVVIRSIYGAPLATSNVFLITGKVASGTTLTKIFEGKANYTMKIGMRPQPEQDTPSLHARMKPGDLYARFPERPEGEVSLCAVPLPDRLDDPQLEIVQKDDKKRDKIPVTCVRVKSTDELIEIAIPPWPRFD